jgi:hypothetical protein
MSHLMDRLFHLSETGLNEEQKISRVMTISDVRECCDVLSSTVLIVLNFRGMKLNGLTCFPG